MEEADDLPDAMTDVERELEMREVAQAIIEWSGGPGRGDAPGGWLQKWAREMLSPPKVNPLRVLAAATRSAISSAVRGAMDWRNGPPSRRRSVLVTLGWGKRAPLLPVLRGPNPRVVFVVDTSGSMGSGTDSALAQAAGEVLHIARACNATPLGMACDAGVHEVRPVRSVNDVLALTKGGGGTDMRVGIAEAAKSKYAANVIVLLTDGETMWPTPHEMPKHAPVVVVLIPHRDSTQVPAHMKRNTITISKGA
jgi:hypothetical protein